jgi:N-acetylmuramoyl-L-alanine amidase CwlA
MRIKIKQALITHPLTRPAIRTVNGKHYKLRAVRAIISHWTANTNRGANAMANRNYFNNGSPGPGGTFRAASAHYCVDSNEIVQCLPDDEVGFHIGGSRYYESGRRIMAGYKSLTPNYFAIGFEMCVNSDGDWNKTYQSSAKLAAYLLFKHKLTINDLLRHYDITGKDCPKMMIAENEWQKFKDTVSEHLAILNKVCFHARVGASNLNARSGPGTQHQVVRVLNQGEPVVCYPGASTNGWVPIGENEFVNSKYLIYEM